METQHWIVRVQDSINDYSEVQSTYFDGTQTAAKHYFGTLSVLDKYWGNLRYQITMQANSITLQWPKSQKGENP